MEGKNKTINKRKYNSLNNSIKFIPEDNDFNEFLKSIKNFGIVTKNVYNAFDSKINFNEKLVISWLNERKFNSQLLFRKTRDGSTPEDFHYKCDNKGITIIFIETVKEYIFGGYTELQWDKYSGYKSDNSTFLFSFNNMEKLTKKILINLFNSYDSIYCSIDKSPWFGNSNPDICFNGTLNNGQTSKEKDTSFESIYKLTNGEEFWEVKELEVHKIIYL